MGQVLIKKRLVGHDLPAESAANVLVVEEIEFHCAPKVSSGSGFAIWKNKEITNSNELTASCRCRRRRSHCDLLFVLEQFRLVAFHEHLLIDFFT